MHDRRQFNQKRKRNYYQRNLRLIQNQRDTLGSLKTFPPIVKGKAIKFLPDSKDAFSPANDAWQALRPDFVWWTDQMEIIWTAKLFLWFFTTIATNLAIWLANLTLYIKDHITLLASMCHAMFCFKLQCYGLSRSSRLASSMAALLQMPMHMPQNDYNSPWIFAITEQLKLYFREQAFNFAVASLDSVAVSCCWL